MKPGSLSMRADLGEHVDHVLRWRRRGAARRARPRRTRCRVGVGVGRADRAHGRGAAVLLVVGVQDEQHVERPRQRGVGVVARLRDLPHHRQEVRGEPERVVGVHERHADAEPVARRRQRGHLGDEPDDLLVAVLGVVDVIGFGVEGRQRGDGGHEHAHRVGVVVEALEEPLAHVLVDVRVVRDVVLPRVELLGVGSSPWISR